MACAKCRRTSVMVFFYIDKKELLCNLNETIVNFIDTAVEPIYIFVILDGFKNDSIYKNILKKHKNKRIRIIKYYKYRGKINAIKKAIYLARNMFLCKSKYLYKSHPNRRMDIGWDNKLKSACKDKSIVQPSFEIKENLNEKNILEKIPIFFDDSYMLLTKDFNKIFENDLIEKDVNIYRKNDVFCSAVT